MIKKYHRSMYFLLLLLFIYSSRQTYAQPFTKKFILSFHTCDSVCTGPQDHLTHLAESDDGTNWTLVPSFVPYPGSVPDVITRNNKLYIFNPGKVRRYNSLTDYWDEGTVTILDSAGGLVNFVDPSAFIDSTGNIILFFLNSTGNPMGQDPASCPSYPCNKYFDSAIEIPGSDGTQFIMQPNHRTVITLQSGTGSDPDIYFDGNRYIMYISKGSNTVAYESGSLHGVYLAISGLNNATLTSMGGIPCGIYDAESQKYWTYVHSNVSGSTVM